MSESIPKVVSPAVDFAKPNLFGKTLTELKQITTSLKMPTFTAKQLAEWMYPKNIDTFEEMTNISKRNRAILEQHFTLHTPAPTDTQKSVDGTKKYLFQTGTGRFIETAMIPDKDRKTICVSSQAGCKMGCRFCMTAKQGFAGNLDVGDILNQYRTLPERDEVTNLVYMGMGEPLDNLDPVLKSTEILTADWGYGMSPKRITISTIGIIPAMETFLKESRCHLAVSLHTPFETERMQLMPIQKVHPIQSIVDTLRKIDFGLQRKLTFEYILFDGFNDTPKHVKGLTKLLNGLRCRINLIHFHAIPDTPFKGSAPETMQQFKDALNQKGLLATIRASRGEDIFAACGLLSTKKRSATSHRPIQSAGRD